MKLAALLISISLLMLLLAPQVAAHDSPIDHIDRSVQIYVESGTLHLIYRIRLEERQALLQLQQMDCDADGKISDSERDNYFRATAQQLTRDLHVQLGGRPLMLSSFGPVQLSPDWSQTYHLVANVGELPAGVHPGKFSDDFSRMHPGPYRWTPRQIEHGTIEVQAVQKPGIEHSGPHPAMIVVDFQVIVKSPDASAAQKPGKQ